MVFRGARMWRCFGTKVPNREAFPTTPITAFNLHLPSLAEASGTTDCSRAEKAIHCYEHHAPYLIETEFSF